MSALLVLSLVPRNLRDLAQETHALRQNIIPAPPPLVGRPESPNYRFEQSVNLLLGALSQIVDPTEEYTHAMEIASLRTQLRDL